MYKFYKNDRGQWVEIGAHNWLSYRAYKYANFLGYINVVDKPSNEYYYKWDCYNYGGHWYSYEFSEKFIERIRNGELDDYKICNECGKIIYLPLDTDYIEYNGDWYCDSDCAYRNGIVMCDDCGEIVERDDCYTTYDGQTICNSCYEDHYFTCDCCGEIYHTDYMHSDDWHDHCYCDNCYEDECCGIIRGYHDTDRDFRIHKSTMDNNNPITMGTEIETECKGSYNKRDVAETINRMVNKNEYDMFIFEEDGSLSDNGYETISQPFTLNWFKENRDMFKSMFEKMVDMGCRSHYTDTCGFHVHVGRDYFGDKQEECINRLIYLFEKYKPELKVFSRRKSFGWCEFPSDKHGDEWKDLKKIKNLCKGDLEGHGEAINLENYNTIELRIFKGTLNFNTYSATLELVNNLISYVKEKTDSEVERGKFHDIIDYHPTEYLKQYCLDRNII